MLDGSREIGRRIDSHCDLIDRQARRMQERPRCRDRTGLFFAPGAVSDGFRPIVGVSENRMTEMGKRCADLMQKARLEFDLDEGRIRKDTFWCHALSADGSTGIDDTHPGRTMLCHGQRDFDALAGFETTLHERKISLANAVFTNAPRNRFQSCSFVANARAPVVSTSSR